MGVVQGLGDRKGWGGGEPAEGYPRSNLSNPSSTPPLTSQRLAMARLLFHAPKFAILDECTSAVSADGELELYRAVTAAGVTVLSIAHRPAVRQFHQLVVHFDGSQKGNGYSLEDLRPAGKA